MSDDEHLTTGWEPDADLDVGDTILRRQLYNLRDRLRWEAETGGHPLLDDPDLIAVDLGGEASFWGNDAIALAPITDLDRAVNLRDRLDALYGGRPYLLWSMWPAPELDSLGLAKTGHPPAMVRPPGGAAPAPPDDLVIAEATDADALAEFERTVIDGFPLYGLEDRGRGEFMHPELLGGPFRFFVGRAEGTPVAVAAAFVGAGVCQVEWVATLEEHRGRGYGEAVTWAATMAAPDLPAVLVASDPGRPVYERMGYSALTRITMWIRDLSVPAGATPSGA